MVQPDSATPLMRQRSAETAGNDACCLRRSSVSKFMSHVLPVGVRHWRSCHFIQKRGEVSHAGDRRRRLAVQFDWRLVKGERFGF